MTSPMSNRPNSGPDRIDPHGYWRRYTDSDDEPKHTLTVAIMAAGEVATTDGHNAAMPPCTAALH